MISGHDILCISFPNWEGDYMKTIRYIMEELAKRNRILYVDYEFTVKDIVTTFLNKQQAPVKRMLGINDRLRTLKTLKGDPVYVLTPPPVLPVNWLHSDKLHKKLIAFNATIVKRTIKWAMKKIDMNSPIVINAFNPFIGLPLVGAFNEKQLIYYCYDEINAAEWSNRHGGRLEREFIQKVDAVIATSQALYESRKQLNKRCFLVKNGVDFELFNKGAVLPENGRIDLRMQNKTVGIIGSLDNRIDYRLLHYLAQEMSDTRFHFIGRVNETDAALKLKSLPNVVFWGAKPVSQLPSYLKHFDLGIIPYLRTELTKNIYPLKINEYLAAGKPVVMTDFADFTELKNIVRIENNKYDFLQAVRNELQTDNAAKQKNKNRNSALKFLAQQGGTDFGNS